MFFQEGNSNQFTQYYSTPSVDGSVASQGFDFELVDRGNERKMVHRHPQRARLPGFESGSIAVSSRDRIGLADGDPGCNQQVIFQHHNAMDS